MPFTVHLTGPDGAGKTSTGRILAQRLGWAFVDLDECFLAREGNIGAFIGTFGYAGYASRNVAIYRDVRSCVASASVFALSSGFMLYPDAISGTYPALRASIEADALTVLLMPAFEREACVDIIVQRQLARACLSGSQESEERKIRERFSPFMALNCARFRSDGSPEDCASQIEEFVRGRLAAACSAQSLS